MYSSSYKENAEELALYKNKISGSSNNFDTFAADLKNQINHYEHRLKNVKVDLVYKRLDRHILVHVTAEYRDSGLPYKFNTIINT